jgi:hypothetical protein
MTTTHIAYVDAIEEISLEELGPGETPEKTAARLGLAPKSWWPVSGEEVELEKARIAATAELKAVIEDIKGMGQKRVLH